MHGDVLVLASLQAVQIMGLYRAFPETYFINVSSAISACRNGCYSNIFCTYWQYYIRTGCWLEDPINHQQVAYPPTRESWVVNTRVAGTAIAGEYIRHRCFARNDTYVAEQVVEVRRGRGRRQSKTVQSANDTQLLENRAAQAAPSLAPLAPTVVIATLAPPAATVTSMPAPVVTSAAVAQTTLANGAVARDPPAPEDGLMQASLYFNFTIPYLGLTEQAIQTLAVEYASDIARALDVSADAVEDNLEKTGRVTIISEGASHADDTEIKFILHGKPGQTVLAVKAALSKASFVQDIEATTRRVGPGLRVKPGSLAQTKAIVSNWLGTTPKPEAKTTRLPMQMLEPNARSDVNVMGWLLALMLLCSALAGIVYCLVAKRKDKSRSLLDCSGEDSDSDSVPASNKSSRSPRVDEESPTKILQSGRQGASAREVGNANVDGRYSAVPATGAFAT